MTSQTARQPTMKISPTALTLGHTVVVRSQSYLGGDPVDVISHHVRVQTIRQDAAHMIVVKGIATDVDHDDTPVDWAWSYDDRAADVEVLAPAQTEGV